MAEHIEAIEAAAQEAQVVDIEKVTNDVDANFSKAEAVTRSFDMAMDLALKRPGQGPKAERERDEMTHGGAVGLEKAEMLTQVDPNAVKVPESELDAQIDVITERVRTLYSELTNWQVAWGISHRVQQDSNQLLKGQ